MAVITLGTDPFRLDAQRALYTLISIFVGAKAYEFMLNHVNKLAVMIITEQGDMITDAVTKELPRGVTKWGASGGYTGDEKTVLFCVIINAWLLSHAPISRARLVRP